MAPKRIYSPQKYTNLSSRRVGLFAHGFKICQGTHLNANYFTGKITYFGPNDSDLNVCKL